MTAPHLLDRARHARTAVGPADRRRSGKHGGADSRGPQALCGLAPLGLAALLVLALSGCLPGYPDVIGELLSEMNDPAGDAYYAIFGNVFGSPPAMNAGSIEGQLIVTDLPLLGEPHNTSVSPFRCVVHARLDTSIGPVDVYNVHLNGGPFYPLALDEIERVLEFIDSTAGQQETVIVAGDFNSLDGSPVFDRLEDRGYVDLGAASGLACNESDRSGCTNATFPLADPENPADVRIDYIWMKAGQQPPFECQPIFNEAFEIAAGQYLWASDHIGIHCSITLPGADPLSVVDFNILHGLLDEDPAAQPFDRFPERFDLIKEELAGLQPSLVLLQEVSLL